MSAQPVRIQRKRTKGFNLQEVSMKINGLPAVSCTRPGKWGNPFKAILEDGKWWVKDNEGNYWDAPHHHQVSAIRVSVRLHRAWIEGKIGIKQLDASELKGKNLACFCPENEICHADYLLEIANK